MLAPPPQLAASESPMRCAPRGCPILENSTMTERSPLLPLARLWGKTSAKGTSYMVGRLGMAKLVLLPVREEHSDGHTHELFVTAPNDATHQASAKGAPSTDGHPMAVAHRHARPKPGGKVSIDDDPVPF